ncbi:MAG: hypothetical protein LBR79_02805 [Oscillospiraceae bacterium]|nr:hypothetical protein [Oscillospiraceae bacterium]
MIIFLELVFKDLKYKVVLFMFLFFPPNADEKTKMPLFEKVFTIVKNRHFSRVLAVYF